MNASLCISIIILILVVIALVSFVLSNNCNQSWLKNLFTPNATAYLSTKPPTPPPTPTNSTEHWVVEKGHHRNRKFPRNIPQHHHHHKKHNQKKHHGLFGAVENLF